jgi:general L-amino acid transport system substrate-binding protein
MKKLKPCFLKTAVLASGALLLALGGANAAGTTLETIRARGHVLCGVGEVQPGFSQAGEAGERSGLDVEFCTALAARMPSNTGP